MKKICENYLEQFYSLDKQERIPLGLSVHLLFCRECRSIVRNLTKAEKILGEKSTQPSSENSQTISSVLKGIKSSNLDYHGHHEEKISLRKWAVSGSILLLCTVLMILLMVIDGEKTVFVTGTISLSAIMCIWCGLFVGNNMDYFVKMSSRINSKNARLIPMA